MQHQNSYKNCNTLFVWFIWFICITTLMILIKCKSIKHIIQLIRVLISCTTETCKPGSRIQEGLTSTSQSYGNEVKRKNMDRLAC